MQFDKYIASFHIGQVFIKLKPLKRKETVNDSIRVEGKRKLGEEAIRVNWK